MLLLLAEIVLTVLVWRKGWKWLSLIPIASALCIGFCIGFSNPETALENPGSYAWIDVLSVIALVLMLIFPPKNGAAQNPGSPPDQPAAT